MNQQLGPNPIMPQSSSATQELPSALTHPEHGDLDTHRNLVNTGMLSSPSRCELAADWKSPLTLSVIKVFHVNAHEAVCFPPVKVLG